MLILSGGEDAVHEHALALQVRVPSSELQVLPGAGHACNIEQPWLFDRLLIEFLRRHQFIGEA
jgi:pimeloyl-ACP methyl ester carboxylesterase